MDSIKIFINGAEVRCNRGDTVLNAALDNEIYIPHICYHPVLPVSEGYRPHDVVFRGGLEIRGDSDEEFEGCRLCLVRVEGKDGLVKSCNTGVFEGMKVITTDDEINEVRKEKLSRILERHPHNCLLCAQREGCSRTQCSSNVAEMERCCERLGNCELQKVSEFVGIRTDLPKYIHRNLPKFEDDPIYTRDYNLCIGCLRCVRACNEMREVGALGFVRRGGEIIVGTRASTLADSGCRYCTACVEVCPTGALLDKDLKAGGKNEALVPCKFTCPAGIDIPEYLRYTAMGRFDIALEIIRERVPFPNSLGHICFHPCESVCKREKVNSPIAICDIKRFVAANDNGKWTAKLKKKERTGKKVAVIGAGPGGLTVAYFLVLKGHSVEVFEKETKAGGMMRYAIPEYRLPMSILDDDLRYIWSVGVKFRGDSRMNVTDLVGKYNAVVIASGNPLSRKMSLDGSETKGVLWGLDFLQSIKKGEDVRLNGKVVVIGGGNVAIDVARCALRLGGKEVTMVCLEKPEEMPAHKWEIDQALEEGVKVFNSWGPRAVKVVNEKIEGVEFMRCVTVFDENKRFSPRYDVHEIRHLEADTVIFAIGQAPDVSFIDVEGIKIEKDLIKTDDDYMTGRQGIFVCGEATKGPGSVIDAIGQGREVAAYVDRFLGGDGDISFGLYKRIVPDPKIGRREDFAREERSGMPVLPVVERRGFTVTELGYNAEMVQKEAGRCLQCDLRLLIDSPRLPPEHMQILTEENVEALSKCEGAFILFDKNKQVYMIKGSMTVKEELSAQLGNENAKFFIVDEDPMYTRKESELIQQYLSIHGEMPPGNSGDLDDLF